MHDARRPRLGYLLAAVAAAMFAVNGSIAKLLLEDGVSASHLSQLRVTVAFVMLAGALAVVDRRRLRIARADVPRMAWLGFAGVAIVQLSYFLAIERMPISVALVIQFTGPAMVLLWLRLAHGRRLKPSLYGAVALSVAGSALVVEVFDAGSIDGLGVLFALVAAVTFAIYLVGFERVGRTYDAFTTLAWGLGFATLFWLLVSPPWRFPLGELDSARNVALARGRGRDRHARALPAQCERAAPPAGRAGRRGRHARAGAGHARRLGHPRRGAQRSRSPAACSWWPRWRGCRATRPPQK